MAYLSLNKVTILGIGDYALKPNITGQPKVWTEIPDDVLEKYGTPVFLDMVKRGEVEISDSPNGPPSEPEKPAGA